jgi:hypothetical protein
VDSLTSGLLDVAGGPDKPSALATCREKLKNVLGAPHKRRAFLGPNALPSRLCGLDSGRRHGADCQPGGWSVLTLFQNQNTDHNHARPGLRELPIVSCGAPAEG